jgi:hypothetical protein
VPLRLLARAAPFVLGAVAAGIWLQRRQAQPPALRERTGEAPPPVPPEVAPRPVRFRRPSIDIVTIVDDLLRVSR